MVDNVASADTNSSTLQPWRLIVGSRLLWKLVCLLATCLLRAALQTSPRLAEVEMEILNQFASPNTKGVWF